MSQGGGHTAKLRAIFAIVAACALFFGLFGGVHRISSRAGLQGATLGVDISCHDLRTQVSRTEASRTQASATDHGAPDENGGGEKRAACPCCLAAHAGPAVLPERFALSLRREPAATPAVYCSSPKSLPHFALRQIVNGARAPPASPQRA